ncbi:Uncharacterised protein [Mycobacteroides abscessus subsp. abscessus]|nr:Uncharacterised protein [Mycobacteroides abscessus subsp. abscessus]SKS41945.1 Uncharacterised protein [Mycobacteroides abscessus subsp. abscessus]
MAVRVTPVRSSMSAAIATASREDRPISTIGAESSIRSGLTPVALAIQLRSHSRISGTVSPAPPVGAATSGAGVSRLVSGVESC